MKLVLKGLSCSGCPSSLTFNLRIIQAFAELKKEGAIVSPVRCKWQPA